MITGPNFQWAVKVEPMMSTFARDLAAKVTGPGSRRCPRRRPPVPAQRPAAPSAMDELRKLAELRDAGIVTPQEFEGDEGAAAWRRYAAWPVVTGPASEAHPLPVLEGRAPWRSPGPMISAWVHERPDTAETSLSPMCPDSARPDTAGHAPDRTGPDRTDNHASTLPSDARAFPPSTRCTARPHNRRARARRHRAA